MFYVRTADRLQRTAIMAEQPRRRARLPEAAWSSTTRSASAPSSKPTWRASSTPTSASGRPRSDDPEKLKRVPTVPQRDTPDPSIVFVKEREQHRPALLEREASRCSTRSTSGCPSCLHEAAFRSTTMETSRAVACPRTGSSPRRGGAALDDSARSTTSFPGTGAAALLGGRTDRDREDRARRRSTRSRTSIRSAARSCSRAASSATARGRPKIASPIYKQNFDLETGACLDDATVKLPVYPVRVVGGRIQVSLAAKR